MQGEIRVTVIATGFDRPQPAASQTSVIATPSPMLRAHRSFRFVPYGEMG